MKKLLLFIAAASFVACSSPGNESSNSDKAPESMVKQDEAKQDDGKGVGEIKEVTLNDPLDQTMIDEGQAIYDLKCAACHKLTDQRVVGPGWAGVTEKRKPEWIMNMILNVDVMLDEDPTARALFEECLTRMPNQNVSVEEGRALLEFMFFNDTQQG